jgi:hypothetical protein
MNRFFKDIPSKARANLISRFMQFIPSYVSPSHFLSAAIFANLTLVFSKIFFAS